MYHILLITFLLSQILFPTYLSAKTGTSSLTREEQKALYEAQEATKGKAFQKAARLLTEHLRKYPDKPDPLVFYALGNAWYLSGNLKNAYNAYEQGFRQYPSSSLLCTNFATVSYKLEKYSKAGELFEKAYKLSRSPQKEMLYQAGTAYYQAKAFKKAKSVLRRLNSGREVMKKSWIQLLIHVCLELKDWREAEKMLLKFLNRNPTDTEYWRLLSQIRFRRNDHRGAASALEILYGISPPTLKELEELANLCLLMNFPLKAIRYLEKAYGPSPTPKQCDRISIICVQARRPDQAIRYLNMAIQQVPSSSRLLEKGKLCYEQGHWNKAITAFRACIQKNPYEELAHLLMGYCAVEKEDFVLARNAFLKASKGKKYRDQALSALKVLNDG